jgi:hypothetical protein
MSTNSPSHTAQSTTQDFDWGSPTDCSDSPFHSLREGIQNLNLRLSKFEGHIQEACQLLPEIRKEVNTLLKACRQAPAYSMSEALADDGRQVIGDRSDTSGDSFVFTIDPVLPDNATESFTLLASDSNSEGSEVKVQSDVVAVIGMKPRSKRLKRKRVGVYSVFSTLANVQADS